MITWPCRVHFGCRHCLRTSSQNLKELVTIVSRRETKSFLPNPRYKKFLNPLQQNITVTRIVLLTKVRKYYFHHSILDLETNLVTYGTLQQYPQDQLCSFGQRFCRQTLPRHSYVAKPIQLKLLGHNLAGPKLEFKPFKGLKHMLDHTC